MKNIIQVEIRPDYETPERAGISGTFQIISITAIDEDGNRFDITKKIDQGMFFYNGNEVLEELRLNPAEVEIEMV